tara:strand:- start:1435 stop:1632 length:198 start_codon:yes stop_codon:yes gene_type:complete
MAGLLLDRVESFNSLIAGRLSSGDLLLDLEDVPLVLYLLTLAAFAGHEGTFSFLNGEFSVEDLLF